MNEITPVIKIEEELSVKYNRFADIINEYPLILGKLPGSNYQVSLTANEEIPQSLIDEVSDIVSEYNSVIVVFIGNLSMIAEKKIQIMKLLRKHIDSREYLPEDMVDVVNKLEDLIYSSDNSLKSYGENPYDLALKLIEVSERINYFFETFYPYFRDPDLYDLETLGEYKDEEYLKEIFRALSDLDYSLNKE